MPNPAPLVLIKRGNCSIVFGVAADPRKGLILESTNMPRVGVLNYATGVVEPYDLPLVNRLDFDWSARSVAASPPLSMLPATLFSMAAPAVFLPGEPPQCGLFRGYVPGSTDAIWTLRDAAGVDHDYITPLARSISVVGGAVVADPVQSYFPGGFPM